MQKSATRPKRRGAIRFAHPCKFNQPAGREGEGKGGASRPAGKNCDSTTQQPDGMMHETLLPVSNVDLCPLFFLFFLSSFFPDDANKARGPQVLLRRKKGGSTAQARERVKTTGRQRQVVRFIGLSVLHSSRLRTRIWRLEGEPWPRHHLLANRCTGINSRLDMRVWIDVHLWAARGRR